LLDWSHAAQVLSSLYPAPKGEKAWPPSAMFKALLLAAWYDLSDVALAEALCNRTSFRRVSARPNQPPRTGLVSYETFWYARAMVRQELTPQV